MQKTTLILKIGHLHYINIYASIGKSQQKKDGEIMNYLKKIEELIVENEAGKKSVVLRDNSNTLLTYWNIGKLIVEAQGGDARAKYGDNLISEWGRKLSEKYGKGYNKSNLSRARTFYLYFPIVAAVRQQLTWTHYRLILPLKNENDFYVNYVEDNIKDINHNKTIAY